MPNRAIKLKSHAWLTLNKGEYKSCNEIIRYTIFHIYTKRIRLIKNVDIMCSIIYILFKKNYSNYTSYLSYYSYLGID